jgi:hypothetical protein
MMVDKDGASCEGSDRGLRFSTSSPRLVTFAPHLRNHKQRRPRVGNDSIVNLFDTSEWIARRLS